MKLMQRVGLDDLPDVPVNKLGVGKQQLIEIAKALSKDVRLLILDEPTASLNDDDSEKLLNLILELREKMGVTAIIISHKLNEVTRISDKITVIRDGRTIETLVKGVDEITEDRIIKGMKGYSVEKQLGLIERLQPRINALIINPVNDVRIAEKIDELVAAGILVVTLNNDIENSRRHCYVGSDYVNGGETAGALFTLLLRKNEQVDLGIVQGNSHGFVWLTTVLPAEAYGSPMLFFTTTEESFRVF